MATLAQLISLLQEQGVESDWVDFIAEELLASLGTVKSPALLFKVIGEHLDSAGIDSIVARSVSDALFDRLKALGLLVLPAEAVKEKEEEEKKKEEESSDEDDEEERIVGEGDCELCERDMPLTKHHLIPREVHEWYKKHHGMTREELHTGVMLCRPCHSAVHKMEDNKTLARDFNTLEKLMAHEKMPKWLAYIRKQKLHSKADKRTLLPNGPRDLPPTYDD